MSATPSKAKQTSRWGSLLQGAVAGIESRLDTILAEDASSVKHNKAVDPIKPFTAAKKEGVGVKNEKNKVHDVPRNLSNTRKNERPLQKYSKSTTESDVPQRPPSAASERSVTRNNALDPASQSLDIPPKHPMVDTPDESVQGTSDEIRLQSDAKGDIGSTRIDSLGKNPKFMDTNDKHNIIEGDGVEVVQQESDNLPGSKNSDVAEDTNSTRTSHVLAESSAGEIPSVLLQIQQVDQAQPEQNAETHALLERIDALQAKLRFLANEAAESARRAASEAPRGSIERSIAEKDAQIAMLLQEGEKLSRSEVHQTSMIRKLRTKVAEDQKTLVEAKRSLKRAENSLSASNEELERVKAVQKSAYEKISRVPRLEKEIETLRTECDSKDSIIAGLKRQVEDALAHADAETTQANAEALIAERKVVTGLREELSSIKLEKQTLIEKGKDEARGLQEHLRREQDRSRAAEESLQNELSLMENKLEMFRARTEEVSSGTTGDAQAKLIRQIETLQTQYAVASENWQGIEGAMQSRLADLEKEKDECQRQEAETRKKAREANSKLRKLQEDFDQVTQLSRRREQDINEGQRLIHTLERRLADRDKVARVEREAFEKDRQNWETITLTRVEEEKLKLRQEITNQAASRTTSPPGTRKISGLEIPSYPPRRIASRNACVDPILPMTDILERPFSRRSSNLVTRVHDVSSPIEFESERSAQQLNSGGRSRTPSVPRNAPETPSIQTADYEDLAENRSSPQRTMNDMISGSTINAGPSVQLVERMSAAVRRLESEKAASKDEINRLSIQRDEARREVVSLMREVEEKRNLDAKSRRLEEDLTDVTRRYQTTLEMLGEKSEQVEELRADVDDLKKIYKDLVERSLK